MTRPAPDYRDRRRELARELADVPAPPPPADLLDAIRDEIPADLAVAGEPAAPERPWWRSPALPLAASIAFVAVGALVVLRFTGRPEIPTSPSGPTDPMAGVITETRPLERLGSPQREELSKAKSESAAAPAGVAGGVADETAGRPDDTRDRRQIEVGQPPVERPLVEEKIAAIAVNSEAPMVDKFDQVASAPEGVVSGMDASRRRAVSDLESRSKKEPVSPSPPPSTGGTAEPNDAPVGDMFFRSTDSNPFVDTREDRLSTFALDVDTGSYTLARSYLERGSLPPAEAIRVEEFVNAQKYDDPAPRRGEFALVAEGAPSPFAAPGDYRLLRFAVKGREIAAADRKPAVLTFVIDVSGSMAQENRLGLVKQALGLLLDELAGEDRVGLVVYGSSGQVVLEHTSDHERIRRAIDALHPGGSTNAEEGLRLGYDLAGAAYRPGWNNRVILCSDGVANVGATGPESILERIGREARRGIELTTVGFGMGNYNDALMEQLADQGDGSYHYVDTLEEARASSCEKLTGTLETIAKDAKVQVEFDPATVERWRLLGYENRDVADRDFRNDRVDAGEIGAGHSATALYEVRLAPRARRDDTIGTLRLRWKSVATGSVEEASLTLRVRDLDSSFAAASDNLRRAAVAAELAEMLKRNFYAKDATWRPLIAEANRLERPTGAARQPDDLRTMVLRAAELSTSGSKRRKSATSNAARVVS